MNAEKLITLIAIPAYDPINIVKIILIISCTMDVCVINACFWQLENFAIITRSKGTHYDGLIIEGYSLPLLLEKDRITINPIGRVSNLRKRSVTKKSALII